MLINTTDKEWIGDNKDRILEEEEKYVDDKILEIEDQIVDDDHRTLCGNKFHLEYQCLIFKEREEFQTRFADLKNYKVIKYGKFIQGLLYFLGYDKEKVTEPGTQKFFWKTAKTLMDDDFLTKMEEYDFRGPKEGVYKPYQTLNFIEKIITGINAEEVDEFNMVAGRLYKWLTLALENRKNDIVRRKSLIHKQREERDNLIKSKEERETKRVADLKEAKDKFQEENKDEIDAYEEWKRKQEGGGDEYAEEEDEEENEKEKEPPKMPEFNEKEFLEKFDEEFPEIVVNENTTDDIDNDWILTEEEIEAEISKFWAARESG